MSRAVDSPSEVTRTETVPENARVRHFDELDDTDQEFLVDATSGDGSRPSAARSGLSAGDVVVFTDYYRVQ